MRSDIKKEREDTRNKHQAELDVINDRCVNINKAVTESLNNIQKQEQNHGKLIYDYMAVNNMYS